MLVRASRPAFARSMDRPVRIGSAVILAVLVLGILASERDNVGDYLADVGVVAGLFCAISLVVGYVVPRAFGVVEDQAIASSMEIGVHNGTLAIFVAENVLDSTEIAVPAAVYSILMFFLAAAWGSVISRRVRQAPGQQHRHLRGDLAQRPAAVRDRVLVGDRQLGGGHARVVVGLEHHVVAEPTAPPHLTDHPALHPPLADQLAAVGVDAGHGTDEVRAAALVGYVGQLGEEQLVVALIALGRAGPPCGEHAGHPVERVDAEAAVVGERGEPGRGRTGPGLDQRVAGERRLVLDRFVVRRHVVEAEHPDPGQVVREDPLHLLELLGVAGGQVDLNHRHAPPAAAG